MKLIVALGNPGKKYEHTRHNAGFLALDYYLKDVETISCTSRFKGTICEAHFAVAERRGKEEQRETDAEADSAKKTEKVFFIKPQTFMNKSGEAVRDVIQFYKANPETDLLVVHDEIDLKFGFWKLAFDSRPAGHNGVKNIVEQLGTQKFHRVRVGVESRKSRLESPTDEYVLQPFSSEELATLQTNVFPAVKQSIEEFIAG